MSETVIKGQSGAIRVTAISTGTATCHTRQEAGRPGASALRRKLDILRDPHWTDPKPIYAYLVEHPEGLFLVDTGDNHRNSERSGYLPRLNPFFRSGVVIKVAPEEEIGPQLTRLGIDPARDLNAVLMTHLHHDHTGGLGHFPHTPILVSEECLEIAERRRSLVGALPSSYPRWFSPRFLEWGGDAIGEFTRSAPITEDGSIVAIEIPGHMEGQVAFLVRGAEVTYGLVGDVTYAQHFLLDDVVDGVATDPEVSLASQRKMKALAESEPLVLLPAHDPEVAERLPANRTMSPSEPIALAA